MGYALKITWQQKLKLKSIFSPSGRYRLLWGLIIFERVVGILVYNLRFGDSDQTILWNMALDLLNGSFYSFAFYGQSYNIAIEAFLAAPLILAGLSYPLSFALITSSLAILPYGILSILFRKKMGDLAGILPLVVLLLMPAEFLMLSSISRGFVQGIALSSIGLYYWASSDTKSGALLSGIIIPLAALSNPNCLLFLPAFLLFSYKEISRIFWAAGGILISSPLVFIHAKWYQLHPDRIVHAAPGTEYSTEFAWRVLQHLDDYFNYITPIFWKAGWLLIPIFYLLLILLYRKSDWPGKLAALAWCIGFAASIFLSKTNEATTSVYFSGGRMFLAWPLILIAVSGILFSDLLKEKWVKHLIPIVCGIVIFKSAIIPYIVRSQHHSNSKSIVHVFEHKDLLYQCLVLKSIANITRADLVEGVSGHTANQQIAYGCACLIPDFPLTYVRGYERRTWLKPLREKATRELLYGTSDIDYMKVGDARVIWKNTSPTIYLSLRVSDSRLEDK